MPKNNIDYTKTIIYKIQHNERLDLIYIGHTTNFDSRQSQHKKSSGCHERTHLYERINAHGGWNAFKMSPIKQVSCKNRIDALIEEQKAMDEFKASLNHNCAHKPTAQQHIENMKNIQKQQQNDKIRQIVEREIKITQQEDTN